MSDATWLPVVWAALLAFGVVAYVLLDGFDLGVGILFAIEHKKAERDIMVNSIAPMWDGNETWLVLGGGGLFAVFPLAYGVFMPAMYPTILAMLMGLIFRGVAFEFRFRARRRPGRAAWDTAFFLGSFVAAFAQGLTLGGLVQGIRHEGGRYAGGWWDWLNAFTVLCGVAVVLGYALLGACWLIWRTEGPLQARVRRYAALLGAVVLGLIGMVSLWTPFLDPQFFDRWFTFPKSLVTFAVPGLILLLTWKFYRALGQKRHRTPFFCVVGWFLLCFAGLGISFWPLMIPPDITIWDAAAPPASQKFLLVGASVLVPIILIYTGYSYWVFRGKVGAETHYH